LEEPISEESKVSTLKFESFESKDLGNNGTLKESIPILEIFESNVQRNVESFDGFDQTLENESVIFPELNSNQKLKAFGSIKESKDDGRSKPRTPKQIDSYGRNFHKGRSISLKVQELDSRLRNLQSFVLSMISG
jgi:hypothetical protein